MTTHVGLMMVFAALVSSGAAAGTYCPGLTCTVSTLPARGTEIAVWPNSKSFCLSCAARRSSSA